VRANCYMVDFLTDSCVACYYETHIVSHIVPSNLTVDWSLTMLSRDDALEPFALYNHMGL
jgi:hypothetical protein